MDGFVGERGGDTIQWCYDHCMFCKITDGKLKGEGREAFINPRRYVEQSNPCTYITPYLHIQLHIIGI